MNLVLIGYRGTGKSTVARQLALRLGWEWVDADVELEFQAGKSIRAIFDEDGETAFRDLESSVIEQLCARDKIVLAAGGGAILREQNRAHLRTNSKVVWLQADVATIVARLEADAATREQRPALTAAGTAQEVSSVLEQRTPVYRECADVEIDTEGKTPAEVAEAILSQLPAENEWT